jgi:hypothetical protein
MRIRVTSPAHLFEQRKREHIERAYRIEDERQIPVNGLCSFIAVRDVPVQDAYQTRSTGPMETVRPVHCSR